MVDFNTPEDFHFVKGDDLSKIRLGGDILPLRETSQRALRGLDIAFLIEASQERKSCLMGEYQPRFEFVRSLDRENFRGIDCVRSGQGSEITQWLRPSATFPTRVSTIAEGFTETYRDAFLTDGDFDYSHAPYGAPSFSNVTAIFNNIERQKRYHFSCRTNEESSLPYNRIVSYDPIPNAEGKLPYSPESPIRPCCYLRYMIAAYNGIIYYWNHADCYTIEWELGDTFHISSRDFYFNSPSSLYARFLVSEEYSDRASQRLVGRYVWTHVGFSRNNTGFSVTASALREASRRALSASGITPLENPGRMEAEGSYAPTQRISIEAQNLMFSAVCDVPMRTRW